MRPDRLEVPDSVAGVVPDGSEGGVAAIGRDDDEVEIGAIGQGLRVEPDRLGRPSGPTERRLLDIAIAVEVVPVVDAQLARLVAIRAGQASERARSAAAT